MSPETVALSVLLVGVVAAVVFTLVVVVVVDRSVPNTRPSSESVEEREGERS